MSSQALTLRDEQALTLRSNEITDIQRLGGLMAASGYFTDARDAAQAAVKIMAGQELGIPPVASMMGINIIKGKVALGGNLIASRIRAHGYDYKHKQFDNKGCVLEFLSKPDASGKRTVLGDSSFTEEDAKAAQINSDMYRKFPRNMYFNRAISNGAKWYTPEVFAGAPVYVPEELGAKVDENGDMVHEEPTREEQTRGRAEARDRKLAEIRSEAPPEQTPRPEYREPSKLDSGVQQQQPDAPEAPRPTVVPVPAPVVSTSRRILSVEEFRAAGKKGQIEAFDMMKEALGEADYYRVLGICGCENANQFRTLGEAAKAYSEMLETYRFAAESRPL